MKFLVDCPRCSQQGITARRYLVSYQDTGRYNVPCEHGHKDVLVLDQQKFEILFEIGANAILDEYFREAVSSFTSSLERTFEFFLKSVFFQKSMNTEMNAMWKQMSNQSERQLGAFLSIYSMSFGTLPRLLSNKEVQFRNEVIHKGKVPTRDEAIAFGQSVLEIIRGIVKMALTNFPDGVLQTKIQHNQECRLPSDPQDLFAGFSTITILNLSVTGDDWHERTLERALSDLAQIRKILSTPQ